MKSVLVLGGTGTIGQAIAGELTSLGLAVTVRGRTRLHDEWEPEDEPWGLVCAFGNYGPKGKFADMEVGEWLSWSVNLFQPIGAVHKFVRMMNGRPGRIVLLSGAGIGSGKHPEERTSYTVAKGALVHFVEAIAPELPNIAINAVAPGAVKSKLNPDPVDPVSPELCAKMVGWLMMGKHVPSGRTFSARHDTQGMIDGALMDGSLGTLRRVTGEMHLTQPNQNGVLRLV